MTPGQKARATRMGKAGLLATPLLDPVPAPPEPPVPWADRPPIAQGHPVRSTPRDPTAEHFLRVSNSVTACKFCGRGIRWGSTNTGRRMPLDPERVRVADHGRGRVVVAMLRDGTGARMVLSPDGELDAFICHRTTCGSREQA